MISEQVEFQISQYADGTLAIADRQRIEDLLEADASARALLKQYRKLDVCLSQLKISPAVRWDRFAEHISNVIGDERLSSAVVGRIGFFQTRWRLVATLLVAASAMFITRQAMRVNHAVAPTLAAPPSITMVTGPQAEVAAGPAVQDVAVGPSPSLAAREGEARYGEGVIGRGPAKVIIVGGLNPSDSGDSHVH